MERGRTYYRDHFPAGLTILRFMASSVNLVVNKWQGVQGGTCSRSGKSEQYVTSNNGHVEEILLKKVNTAKSDEMYHGGRLSGDSTVYREMECMPWGVSLNNASNNQGRTGEGGLVSIAWFGSNIVLKHVRRSVSMLILRHNKDGKVRAGVARLQHT